jgi:DnaK suppressor protein
VGYTVSTRSLVDTDATHLLQRAVQETFSSRGAVCETWITEERLRRELDLVLVRLAQYDHAALIDARSEGDRSAGDMSANAQVVASRDLGQLSYERLARRAKVLAIAMERVRDGSYGSCEECGSTIPEAQPRAIPGVTKCLPCQELSERHSQMSATYGPRPCFVSSGD